MKIADLKVGGVYEFLSADRKITELGEKQGSFFDVSWEYADGKKRAGRLGGTKWGPHFAQEAKSLRNPEVLNE